MAEELIHIYIRKTDWQNQTMKLVHRYYEKISISVGTLIRAVENKMLRVAKIFNV